MPTAAARLFATDAFPLPLPAGHRFPIEKYALLRERVVAAGIVAAEDIGVPDPIAESALRAVHAPAYVDAVFTGTLPPEAQRRIGFPWSPAMVERSRRSAGATAAAAEVALAGGLGITLAGGTHHAMAARGEGYCVFNDVAVAAHALRQARRVRRVLVIDCDVHQGNGTAALFRDDPTVFTFDVYGARNYPFDKVAPDLAIPLPDGTGDDGYVEALTHGVRNAFARAKPEIVFYVSGADPYEGDRLGRLALTRQGLAERDRTVFAACRAAGVPTVVTMAGGYAATIADTVEIHFNTVTTALRIVGGDAIEVIGLA
ncbi:MAG TPA: histone deacetylase [Gemmatimonadales bacterium]|nr:histone deacetylase [Gemmatimonadales bacterium]